MTDRDDIWDDPGQMAEGAPNYPAANGGERMTDDPFKPLSAKGKKTKLGKMGREVTTPARQRAGEERAILAAIKAKKRKKPK